jgi:hypothetical protein
MQTRELAHSSGAEDRWTGRFVWAVWCAFFVAALSFAFRYGSPMPLEDEWEFVPYLTGERSLTARSLWSPHNEHRMPLPQLIFLGEAQLTAATFPLGPFVNVTVQAALAACFIGTARRLRGVAHWADAFFAITLLHWGHHEAFLMPLLIQFIAAGALAGAIVIMIARRPEPTVATGLGVGALLLILPLLGQNGVAYVPPLALWLAVAGLRRCSSGAKNAWSEGVPMIGLAGLAILLVAAYFIELPLHGLERRSPGPLPVLATGLRFLGMAVGLSNIRLWPGAALAVAALVATTLGLVVAVFIRKPQERTRSAGLILFLSAIMALTTAVAFSRASVTGDNGFASRYSTLMAPALCAVYLIWCLYGHAKMTRVLQATLCLSAGLFCLYDARHGVRQGSAQRTECDQLVADIDQGTPFIEAARRVTRYVYPNPTVLADRLESFYRRGFGPFQAVRSAEHRESPSAKLTPTK